MNDNKEADARAQAAETAEAVRQAGLGGTVLVQKIGATGWLPAMVTTVTVEATYENGDTTKLSVTLDDDRLATFVGYGPRNRAKRVGDPTSIGEMTDDQLAEAVIEFERRTGMR